MRIHPDTQMGQVSLRVKELTRSIKFYEQVVGLKKHWQQKDQAGLGVGGDDLLVLQEFPPGRVASQYPGLYHFALLLPTRKDLAQQLVHLAQTGIDLGASDHYVSEALYFSDPDGHGIEIYADRPRSYWTQTNGRVHMTTEALHVNTLLAELTEEPHWLGLPAGTKMGHVHLQVGNTKQAKQFYTEILGFDLIMDYGSQASFVSAGGYHHHLGLNSWHSAGQQTTPADVLGLQQVTIILPNQEALDQLTTHIQAQNWPLNSRNQTFMVEDPFGIQLLLTTATTPA